MATSVASLIVDIGSNVSGLQGGLDEANRGIDNFATRAGKSMRDVGGALSTRVTLPLLAIGAVAANAAIEWESAFAGVVKTVNASDAELAELERGLRDLATSVDSPVAGMENAATTLAQIAEAAGQLGVATADILPFTETMAMLGMSTNLAATEAASLLAQFANVTGMDMSNISNLGSVIVALGNNMATTEADIVQFAQRIAAVGSGVGLTEAEIMGLSAAMASLGLNPEAAGTAMTTFMNTITQAVAKGGPELETLAAAANTTADAFRQGWADNPAQAMQDFLVGLSAMSPAEQLGALEELGLSGIRVSDTLLRMASNTDLVASAMGIANTAWAENTALMTEAEARFATTESQMNLLGNNLNEVAITIGSALLPGINDLVALFVPMLQNIAQTNPELIQLAVGLGIIAAAAGPVTAGLGALLGVLGSITLPMLALGAAIGALIALLNDPAIQGGLGAFFGALEMLPAVIEVIAGRVAAAFDDLAATIRGGMRDANVLLMQAEMTALAGLATIQGGNLTGEQQARVETLGRDIQTADIAKQTEAALNAQLAAGGPITLTVPGFEYVASGEAGEAARQSLISQIADPTAIQQAAAAAVGTEAGKVLIPLAIDLATDPNVEIANILSAALATGDISAMAQAITYIPEISANTDPAVTALMAQITAAITGISVNATATANINVAANINTAAVSTAVAGAVGAASGGTASIAAFAQGGQVPYTGLIYAHAGEQVLTPAEAAAYRAGARGGGAGNVTNVYVQNYGESAYEMMSRVQRAAGDASPG